MEGRYLDIGLAVLDRVRVYTGVLGQIGDIVAFTATARRVKELWPNAEITFAASARDREAGELVAGLPYGDRLFVTRLYFEKLTPPPNVARALPSPQRARPWKRKRAKPTCGAQRSRAVGENRESSRRGTASSAERHEGARARFNVPL